MRTRGWSAKWIAEDLGKTLLANDGSEIGQIVDHFEIADRCRTVREVTIREEEHLQSDDFTDLPRGTFLLVTEVGTGGQNVKVAGFGFEGWISCRVRHGERRPIVLLPDGRRRADLNALNEDVGDILAAAFHVGERYAVASAVTVRTEESLQSDFVMGLTPGTKVKIVRMGTTERRRVKVSVSSVEGWLSLVTREGELLVDAGNLVARGRFDFRRHFRHLNAAKCLYDKTMRATTALEEALAFTFIADSQCREQQRNASVLKLPTFEFGLASCAAQAKFEPTCSICLEDFCNGDQVKQLPCDHMFHAACVDRWLAKNDACPLRCQASISTL